MKPSSTKIPWLAFACLFWLLIAAAPRPDTPAPDELRLRLSKVFGYASLAVREVQGVFDLKAEASETVVLQRVWFYLDDNLLGEDAEAPFELRFSTDQFSLGMHSLTAIAITADGRELTSNVIETKFVTSEEGMKAGLSFAGPILALTFGFMILSFVWTFIAERGVRNIAPGTPRKYGLAGGAICPRCNRPYARHFWAPNLGVGKYDRCPFCGKWAIVRAQSLETLRQAEATELEIEAANAARTPVSEEERLRKALEDSRYQQF